MFIEGRINNDAAQQLFSGPLVFVCHLLCVLGGGCVRASQLELRPVYVIGGERGAPGGASIMDWEAPDFL